MNFKDLVEKVNSFSDRSELADIVNSIAIDSNNFNEWINNVFSEKVNQFDMNKLPYLIDELYKTTDKIKFMLCCMLLESTCDKLAFVTNLEDYPLFVAKFEALVNTLVTVYQRVDNGISDCMALIILKNDPKFEHFDKEQKNTILTVTKEKLRAILNYLKKGNIDQSVYQTLEVIIDLACYLNDDETTALINEIDDLGENDSADIFIIKYKVINNINIKDEKLSKLKSSKESLWTLYNVMEKLDMADKYLSDVTQDSIAKSYMIKWLLYPTELGDYPDTIELLGSFVYNNTKCYAYKFSKDDFKIQGEMLGVSGGYPVDKVSSISSGYTFSKFENVSDNWEKQAEDLVKFIANYWKDHA